MITPIALTVVDWDGYLTVCRSLLNRSVTESLDKQHRPVKTLPGFIATLADAARLSETLLLRHLSASFIIDICDPYISENSQLTCTTLQGRKPAMILSGNLLQWKESIVNFCQEHTPDDIRKTFNDIQVAFENVGIVWDDYVKVQRPGHFYMVKS